MVAVGVHDQLKTEGDPVLGLTVAITELPMHTVAGDTAKVTWARRLPIHSKINTKQRAQSLKNIIL
jgi:hypothetical protein